MKVREGLRAGEVVGEGRVEEGGGVRGSEAPRRSTRGDQAAVCVHIDTQSSGSGSDEAHFALQTNQKSSMSLAYSDQALSVLSLLQSKNRRQRPHIDLECVISAEQEKTLLQNTVD